MAKQKIVLAASEVVGFAKTGGLADVVGSLPRALAQRGHSCIVFLPLYRGARSSGQPMEPTRHVFQVPMGSGLVTGRLWQSSLPESDVPVYLIEQNNYFDRDNAEIGHGLYQFLGTHGHKRDYPDNCQRFAFLSRAVLEVLPLLDFWPDVLHINDWQTGLAPVYLEQSYQTHSDPKLREKYQHIRCLFTIHNMAYQGMFPASVMPSIGLDWEWFNHLQLEYYDHVNCLKGGVVFSQLINTVSPTYSREIQTPEHGWGLESVLAERKDRLSGIVNGVDYRHWSPESDKRIPATYRVDAIQPGKGKCKKELQKQFGLPEEPKVPLIGMVARLVDQKGPQLLIPIVPNLMSQGCQLVILGDGEQHYHDQFQDLQSRYPGQIGLKLGFSESLAHQIEAGADIFVMPSLYEPSGLNQLYSLKYGTVPVVRSTGGLVDTVTDCNSETLANGTATGFRFDPPDPGAFLSAIQRAVHSYRHDPKVWQQLMQTGMKQDWSWDRSAAEYEKLYLRLRAEF